MENHQDGVKIAWIGNLQAIFNCSHFREIYSADSFWMQEENSATPSRCL